MPRHIYPPDHVVCQCARCRDRRLRHLADCIIYRAIKRGWLIQYRDKHGNRRLKWAKGYAGCAL